jgi:nucleotide-binding universal stress UspA family protein/predicted GNAT family acetyltransferase
MYEKILLPTDFSGHASDSVRHINHIPGVQTVILLHVIDARNASSRMWISDKSIDTPIEQADRRLQEEKTFIESLGPEVKVVMQAIEHGSIADAIIDQAIKEKVSLIVIGARGRGIIQGRLLGSVSAGVLRHAKSDVLVFRYHDFMSPNARNPTDFYRDIFSKVICPVDFSRPSWDAISFVQGLDEVGEIVLVHVIESAETREELKAQIEKAEAKLEGMRTKMARRNLKVTSVIRLGSPSEEISSLAEEEDATLIMMSRFGRSDYVRNILIGGTTADVARKARRSVLVRIPLLAITVRARELTPAEFPLAEEIWEHYHQQKADRENDRIFGVFLDENLASVARCKRHPKGGHEVDAVFTPDEFRGRGYAKKAVEALVDACGEHTLYMHSTLELVPFYSSFGFREIPERDLPPSIQARYGFAMGDMRGSQVSPMMRPPGKR